MQNGNSLPLQHIESVVDLHHFRHHPLRTPAHSLRLTPRSTVQAAQGDHASQRCNLICMGAACFIHFVAGLSSFHVRNRIIRTGMAFCGLGVALWPQPVMGDGHL